VQVPGLSTAVDAGIALATRRLHPQVTVPANT
jgi:hypothetical protein